MIMKYVILWKLSEFMLKILVELCVFHTVSKNPNSFHAQIAFNQLHSDSFQSNQSDLIETKKRAGNALKLRSKKRKSQVSSIFHVLWFKPT